MTNVKIEAEKTVKIVVVGDTHTDKTALLITYTSGSFPHEYVPTVFDNYSFSVLLNDKKINVTLWDTYRQEDYERLRPLSYPNTDIFIVTFSIVGSSSFRNVRTHWSKEINHYMPKTPCILLGVHREARDDNLAECISVEQGRDLAKQLGYLRYMECSIKQNSGVKEVFDSAIRQAVFKRPSRPPSRKKQTFSTTNILAHLPSRKKKRSVAPPKEESKPPQKTKLSLCLTGIDERQEHIARTFFDGSFLFDYTPTIEDSYRKYYRYNGIEYFLEYTVTSSEQEYHAMKGMTMKAADATILCLCAHSNSFEERLEFINICAAVKGVDNPAMIVAMDVADYSGYIHSRYNREELNWANLLRLFNVLQAKKVPIIFYRTRDRHAVELIFQKAIDAYHEFVNYKFEERSFGFYNATQFQYYEELLENFRTSCSLADGDGHLIQSPNNQSRQTDSSKKADKATKKSSRRTKTSKSSPKRKLFATTKQLSSATKAQNSKPSTKSATAKPHSQKQIIANQSAETATHGTDESTQLPQLAFNSPFLVTIGDDQYVWTRQATSGDGDCFFHALGLEQGDNPLDRRTMIAWLLSNSHCVDIRQSIALDIRAFLYTGFIYQTMTDKPIDPYHREMEQAVGERLLYQFSDITQAFEQQQKAEEQLRQCVVSARELLGEAQTMGLTATELLDQLRQRNQLDVVTCAMALDNSIQAVNQFNDLIQILCCREAVFLAYVQGYFDDAKGYMPFRRSTHSEINDNMAPSQQLVDILAKAWGITICMWVQDNPNQPPQCLNLQQIADNNVRHIFYNGGLHFESTHLTPYKLANPDTSSTQTGRLLMLARMSLADFKLQWRQQVISEATSYSAIIDQRLLWPAWSDNNAENQARATHVTVNLPLLWALTYSGCQDKLEFCLSHSNIDKRAWLAATLPNGLNPLHVLTLGTHSLLMEGFVGLAGAGLLERWLNTARYILRAAEAIIIKDTSLATHLLQASTCQGQSLLHLCLGEIPAALVYFWISQGAPCCLINTPRAPANLAHGALYSLRSLLKHKYYPPIHAPKTRFELEKATALALWAKLAYIGRNPKDIFCQSTWIDGQGNEAVKAFSLRWGYQSYAIECKELRALLAVKLPNANDMSQPPHLILSFRGTKTAKNWLTDINATKDKTNERHAGFVKAVQTLWPFIQPIIEKHLKDISHIYVTGHSLGGAMAMIAFDKLWRELNISSSRLFLYNFAAPRAGKVAFQQRLDATFSRQLYCIVRTGDPVPTVPTCQGPVVGEYAHAGSLIFLDKMGQLHNSPHYQLEDILLSHRSNQTEINSMADLLVYCQAIFQTLLVDNIKLEPPTKIQNDLVSMICSLKPDIAKHLLKRHGMDHYLDEIYQAHQRNQWRPSEDEQFNGVFKPVCGLPQTLLVTGDWYTDDKKARYKQEKLRVLQKQLCHYLERATGGTLHFIEKSLDNAEERFIWRWVEEEKDTLQVLQTYTEKLIEKVDSLKRQNIDKGLPKDAGDNLWKNQGISPMVYWACLRLVRLASLLPLKDCQAFLADLAHNLPKGHYSLNISYTINQADNRRAFYPQITYDEVSQLHNKKLIQRFFDSDSEKINIEGFYTEDACKIISQCIDRMPNSRGYRLSVENQEKQWYEQLALLIEPLGIHEQTTQKPVLTLLINGNLKRGIIKEEFAEQIRRQCVAQGNHRVWQWMLNNQECHFSCYVKEFPELPGLERAYYHLAMRIMGEGVPPNCLAKLELPTGKGKIEVVPLLISQAAPGTPLSNHPCIKQGSNERYRLDRKRYSQLFLLTLLTLVEDAKPDNLIVEERLGLDGQMELVLSSIDNDHIFIPAFYKGKLNLKTILFCFDEMELSIDAQVINEFLSLDLELLLRDWLQALKEEDSHIAPVGNQSQNGETLYTSSEYQHFMKHKCGNNKKSPSIQRAMFKPGMVHHMYLRVRQLRGILQRSKALTHRQLLALMLPDVAAIYDIAYRSSPYPIERFNKATAGLYNIKKALSDSRKNKSSKTLGENSPQGVVHETITTSIQVLCTGGEIEWNTVLQSPLANQYSVDYQLGNLDAWISREDNQAIPQLLCYLERKDRKSFEKLFKTLPLILQEYFINKHVQSYHRHCKSKEKRDYTEERMIDSIIKLPPGLKKINLNYYEKITVNKLDSIVKRHGATLETLLLKRGKYIIEVGSTPEHDDSAILNWVNTTDYDFNSLRRLDVTGCSFYFERNIIPHLTIIGEASFAKHHTHFTDEWQPSVIDLSRVDTSQEEKSDEEISLQL